MKTVWVCHFINSRGDTRARYFKTADEAADFTATLDKRIERGSCGGYILSDFRVPEETKITTKEVAVHRKSAEK